MKKKRKRKKKKVRKREKDKEHISTIIVLLLCQCPNFSSSMLEKEDQTNEFLYISLEKANKYHKTILLCMHNLFWKKPYVWGLSVLYPLPYSISKSGQYLKPLCC